MKRKKLDVRRLAKTRFAVIGSGSEKELEKYGFYGDLMPEVYDGEHLGMALAAVCEEELAKKDTEKSLRILIPRAADRQSGADFGTCTGIRPGGYRMSRRTIRITDWTRKKRHRRLTWQQSCRAAGRDYVIFTSASTVKGFAAAAAGLDDTKVRAICIGRQTKEAADALGMQTWMSEKASIDSLIDKLMEVSGRKSVLL